jgi:hypothetical protein
VRCDCDRHDAVLGVVAGLSYRGNAKHQQEEGKQAYPEYTVSGTDGRLMGAGLPVLLAEGLEHANALRIW